MNELKTELASVNALEPFDKGDTSSRRTMFSSSHIAQRLTIEHPTPRCIQTGAEILFGDLTFKIKFPCDAHIVRIIPKYRPTLGSESIEYNPMSLIIYEDIHHHTFGIIEVLDHSTQVNHIHQHYGFKYKTNPNLQLTAKQQYKKDTVIASSPDIDEDGNYRYGIEANVAYMSVPGVIEDGVVVSRSFCEKLKTKGYERRKFSWGSRTYPLNLYGDPYKGIYKPFPDIGERIRSDGVLFALRSYDESLSPVEMHPLYLQQPDYIFDEDIVYGIRNAKVVDINVQHCPQSKVARTPVGMEKQANKYHKAATQFYYTLLEVYNDLEKQAYKRGEKLHITPEFHRWVVEAIDYVGLVNNPCTKHFRKKDFLAKRRIQKTYRKAELDEWNVEVIFEYDLVARQGFKITDTAGGKAVVCAVWEDEDMPVDQWGNRADIIKDSDTIIKRMNLSALFNHYITACSRDFGIQWRSVVDQDPDRAWTMLLEFYQTVSPMYHDIFVNGQYPGTPAEHMAYVKDYFDKHRKISLWVPVENPKPQDQIVTDLQAKYPPNMGPVTYAGGVKTKSNVLIGSNYYMLLEKTATGYTGVASGKLGHFGTLARLTQKDKYSAPGRMQPVRILGEDEIRSLIAIVGSDIVADWVDQANNPITHQEVVKSIYDSLTPTMIESVVDRTKVPLGGHRPLNLIKHLGECCGYRYVRTIHDPYREKQIQEAMGLVDL